MSIFTGIGGFELANIATGNYLNITDAIENSPFKQKILSYRFPDLKIHDDIETYCQKEDETFSTFLIGLPCKGFSNAGKREGLREPRSALWWATFKLLLEISPKYVLLENVDGFVHRGLREVLTHLLLAGYNLWDIFYLSAKEFGSIHRRKRLFFIAYADRLIQGDRFKLQPSRSRQVRNSFKDTLKYPTPLEFSSADKGMDDGVSFRLDKFKGSGYWANSYRGAAMAKSRTIIDRQFRMGSLGDAVVPVCAAIAIEQLLNLDYLLSTV